MDVELLFHRCDLDSDDFLGWSDFLLSACNKNQLLSDENLTEAFEQLDIYSKKLLSFDDFERFFGFHGIKESNTPVWEFMLLEAASDCDIHKQSPCLLELGEFKQILTLVLDPFK